MSKYKWHQSSVGEFIDFNPSESLPKNKIARKVPMEKLGVFERKIKGFEYAEYKGGPKFRNGDTLVAKITPCLENGKTAFVDILNDDEVAYGSSEFIVLRENEWSDKKFIYYLARSPLFRERAISCMEGTSGRKRVNEGALKRQRILVPELKDQRRIAAILSAFDDKIELNNKTNAELEQMAKTLYDYWFVQFDFPNAKGKPYKSSGGKMVYNDVLKREVPEGWKVKSLGELSIFLTRGISPKYTEENGIPVVNQRCIRNNTINFDFCRRHNQHQKPIVKLLQLGDILVNSTGVGTLGRVAIVRRLEDELTTTDSHVTIVRIDPEEANPFFIGVTILDKQPEIEQLGEGSTGQTELSRENLGKLKLLLPNRELQEAFERIASPLFHKITNNEQENQQLAALRDWLLPMLMNGQAKVLGNYGSSEEAINMTFEPSPEYHKKPQLNIPSNKKGFAKQVLAGRIISLFKNDPHFTDIKFQKIQFLAEHIIQANLNLNYYYQAAGPYDNVFMHTIYNDLKKNKWYDCKDKKFTALEKHVKIEEYYQNYFGPTTGQLDKLFRLLSGATEAKSEIVATIYAVWNNFIIEGKPVTENELIQSFYDWSERKHQYSQAQVIEGLQWLRENKLEPTGFGKLIKKAKSKK